MYELLPKHLYPKTIYVEPGEAFAQVAARVAAAGFSYPFCTKPDVGMKGLLFRKIDTESQLAYYHQHVPVAYMIQELVRYPLEVSIFYYRQPAEAKGVVSGFIQKDLMEVVGDGMHTLRQLIQQHADARYREDELHGKHGKQLDQILQPGERYALAYAANLSRGARFKNLNHLIDAELLQLFDKLSHATTFYYGRYDIKCNSIAELKRGTAFSILEFNGSGAEPNHVYHAGYTLFGAQRIFLQHWKALFQISRYNHRAGIRYWSFLRGWNFLQQAKKHLRLLEQYDRDVPL